MAVSIISLFILRYLRLSSRLLPKSRKFFHIFLLFSVDLKLCCKPSLFSCTRSKLRCSQQVLTDGFSGEHLVKPKQLQKLSNHPEVSEVLKIKVGCFLGRHMHLDYLKQIIFVHEGFLSRTKPVNFITTECKSRNVGVGEYSWEFFGLSNSRRGGIG